MEKTFYLYLIESTNLQEGKYGIGKIKAEVNFAIPLIFVKTTTTKAEHEEFEDLEKISMLYHCFISAWLLIPSELKGQF